VRVPLGRDVPVLVDDTADVPWLVVPAHAANALQFARANNLTPDPPCSRSDGNRHRRRTPWQDWRARRAGSRQ